MFRFFLWNRYQNGRTVGNVAPKVLADDDVPGSTVTLVELFLDLRRDVLLDVVLFESSRGDVHALLLHVLGHVDVFDDRLGSAHASGPSCTAYACVGGSGGGVDFFRH